MERERGFNFKLLVPPRVIPLKGQVSTVKPQEIGEYRECSTHTLHQQQSNLPFSSTNMFEPAKPMRSGILLQYTNCQNSQLYSKLFEEVQKVKCWKVKVESEAVQKDRKLQENKRTIETQRKAIQELQFGNESLSIKLEDQISENEDLRNKNNATRNLCNVLKDAFDRSEEKIHLFESEREETHHLFMDNSESIQRMIASFESLRIQTEADRHEMLKGIYSSDTFQIPFYIIYNSQCAYLVIYLERCSGKRIFSFTQSKIQDIEGQLSAAMRRNETSMKNIEKLKADIVQYEGIPKRGLCLLKYNNDENVTVSCLSMCFSFSCSQNKTLKKQIAIGTAKSNELENEINKLKEESEDLKQSNEEERKRLLDDLEMKSTSEAELHRKHTATEALDSKEDAEIKCQNKIADMVALMEKHKKQYDRMVEEKDAELNEKKRNNMEATANRTSMWLSPQSYRIRTPPSLEKSMPWGKSTLELDPKSDSSEHNDLLVNNSVPFNFSKLRKIQSPAIHKSPGSALKLAAMKRMRDAGWTAVTGANKKKKKAVEKIFA
uniref:Synaptonemal complex protein 1 n=1 Tax=Esox lucius TaxID=8010 RepID=A0AAY5L1I6_ESOLU